MSRGDDGGLRTPERRSRCKIAGAWQGHAHHFVKSENAIENKRWVGFDITEVKSNSSMVYICIACGGLSLYVCCTSVVAHPFHAGFAGRPKTHVQITDR